MKTPPPEHRGPGAGLRVLSVPVVAYSEPMSTCCAA